MSKKNHSMSDHHRKPQCKGGKRLNGNISRVRDDYHRAYHLLFKEGDPEYIAKVLNETWIDPEYLVIVIKKTL